jgi:2-iminobutanoate/2-iminopropanoate deaminase
LGLQSAATPAEIIIWHWHATVLQMGEASMSNQNEMGGFVRRGLMATICVLLGAGIIMLGGGRLAAIARSVDTPAVQYIRASDPTSPFSAAVRVEHVLYLSGQIGAGPDGQLPPQFADQARQTLENVRATLKTSGLGMDDIFKCTVMLADMSHWGEFNKIYVTYFRPDRLPARSAIGANGLARGAMLEVECLAYSPHR